MHALLPFLLAAHGLAAAALVHPREPPTARPTPTPPALFFGLDAGFGDRMVLQRAPAAAAVYGFLDTPNATGVRVTVSSNGVPLYTVDAQLNVTAQAFGDGWGARPCPKAVCPPYDMATFTPFDTPLPTWKALLQPAPAGGDYEITAVCTGCGAAALPIKLVNATFGDIYVCAGQSNAMLWVSHTFSRNESAGNYSAGRFNNIRIMGGNDVNEPYAAWPPAYGGGAKATNAWMTAREAVPAGCIDAQDCPLFQTSGACWYALQSVAEQGVDVPLGLVALTLGGQRIEEFMDNTTSAVGPHVCANLNSQNIPWWNGQLYGVYMLPFVDTSIKGWLWYQGENNMGGEKGNVLANTGYACAMRQLIRGWRAAWSKTPGTTDALAPFGVVTLASSGSEGGPNFGAMRLAQTASFGVLPSPELPATFLAQAYDLDDPWGPEAGPCFAGKGGWACCPSVPKAYNATTCGGREALCAPACAAQAGTPVLMGGIHPRSKKEVGDRLGRAMLNTIYGGAGAFTGPTLAGCALAGGVLTVSFNETLLRGDTLALQPAFPLAGGGGGSQLWVQTNASLFCLEPTCVLNATTGACAVPPRREPASYTCPTWAGGDGVTVLPAGAFDSGWTQLNFTAAASGTAIIVDLAPLAGAAPTAVRYAWGATDCCDHTDPTLFVSHGCIAQCPIMSSSGLPANPFQARIVSGACSCVAPQVCG